jgi:hypothetical protein
MYVRMCRVEKAVLWIQDILVWIRICRYGTSHWLTDPYPDPNADPDADPDPAFSSVADEKPKKNSFFSKFFGLLLFEDTFTSFFKDKK